LPLRATTQFVTLLYQNVLGRAPDQPGLIAWTDKLTTHALDRTGVLSGIENSTEFFANTTAKIEQMALSSPTTRSFDTSAASYFAKGFNIPPLLTALQIKREEDVCRK
jgi:hypothetical protein